VEGIQSGALMSSGNRARFGDEPHCIGTWNLVASEANPLHLSITQEKKHPARPSLIPARFQRFGVAVHQLSSMSPLASHLTNGKARREVEAHAIVVHRIIDLDKGRTRALSVKLLAVANQF
jgi:hypothetical protein